MNSPIHNLVRVHLFSQLALYIYFWKTLNILLHWRNHVLNGNIWWLFAGHVFAFGENRGLAIANMVLGLKELQIRGEIRTNVDYTVDLLHVICYLNDPYLIWYLTIYWKFHPSIIFVSWQAQEYRENKIHTGWLDSRIAMRIRAERPPWYLSVIGGALYVRKHLFVFSFSANRLCLFG